jgi:hypothetical protein
MAQRCEIPYGSAALCWRLTQNLRVTDGAHRERAIPRFIASGFRLALTQRGEKGIVPGDEDG